MKSSKVVFCTAYAVINMLNAGSARANKLSQLGAQYKV